MTISFNSIPAGQRVPFCYVEFDSSKAQQGPSVQAFKLLVLGQKLSTGTKTADVPVRVTSTAQALQFFGEGSMLHGMLEKVFLNNKFTAVTVIPLADNGAGVQAGGAVLMAGTATEDGTLSFYVGGRKVEAAIVSGNTAAQAAAALIAAVNALKILPLTALVNVSAPAQADLTARHKGLLGNKLDLRFNYQDDEKMPAGLSATITPMGSGTTAPTLTAAISAMAEVQYNVIAMPYLDATSYAALNAELVDRWGPVRQIDGVAIACQDDTHANLITLGAGKNSKHLSIMGDYKKPIATWERCAALAAVVSYNGAADPARPLQTLEIKGDLPAAQADLFTVAEQNLLLNGGIATSSVDSSGAVRISRLITTYQTNEFVAADMAYLDIETVLTLSFLRYDFKAYFLTKYPRHKLANDGTRYGAGQAVMTPKVGKAEALVKFRQWEQMGLVEGVDQFKRDLIVERNQSDPSRLDFLLPPDLVNGLRVSGVQIGFLL